MTKILALYFTVLLFINTPYFQRYSIISFTKKINQREYNHSLAIKFNHGLEINEFNSVDVLFIT